MTIEKETGEVPAETCEKDQAPRKQNGRIQHTVQVYPENTLIKIISRVISLRKRSILIFRRKRDKSEERRARKAEKKRLKEEDEARQVAELSIYSATDNPFHDVNLGQQFRWHKKIEKDKKQGLSLAESERRDAIRRQEAVEELERLNKRRAEREAEMRLREEEEIRMQRLAESSQMAEWLSKDGEFQLEQERRRASIRLKEKRARAVDFLVLNLTYINPNEEAEGGLGIDEVGLEIDLDEPYTILEVKF